MGRTGRREERGAGQPCPLNNGLSQVHGELGTWEGSYEEMRHWVQAVLERG